MFGAPLNPSVKWYVSYDKQGTTYYLSVAERVTRLTWSQRREKAIGYNSSNEAQQKADEINKKRAHNKKLTLKVI